MENKKAKKLWPEDQELFDRMQTEAVSDNEREFFRQMRYKEEYVWTIAGDLVLWELDNEDHIYMVRTWSSEYDVGHGTEGHYDEEQHTMNLAEALAINLKDVGYLDENITLLDWLRKRDYAGVLYNHN